MTVQGTTVGCGRNEAQEEKLHRYNKRVSIANVGIDTPILAFCRTHQSPLFDFLDEALTKRGPPKTRKALPYVHIFPLKKADAPFSAWQTSCAPPAPGWCLRQAAETGAASVPSPGGGCPWCTWCTFACLRGWRRCTRSTATRSCCRRWLNRASPIGGANRGGKGVRSAFSQEKKGKGGVRERGVRRHQPEATSDDKFLLYFCSSDEKMRRRLLQGLCTGCPNPTTEEREQQAVTLHRLQNTSD